MPSAPLPDDELDRILALRSYQVLDSDCEKAFDEIARLAARLTERPIALVSLVDTARQWFKAEHGLGARETHRDVSFCAHAILHSDRPLVVPDATLDRRFVDNRLVTDDPGIRCYAGVPLTNPEGFALGTLCVIDRQPRELSADQMEALTSLAHAVSTALELRRAMHRLRDQAMTDGLTGLPNRIALVGAIEDAIQAQERTGSPFSLLFLDLDGFKRINDQLGHASGDAVLRVVAEVLRTNLRRRDLVGRLGGDEFCVLLKDTAATAEVAERLRAKLAQRMAQHNWDVTASIGGVTFHRPPANATAALDMADLRMYAAKAGGKNRVDMAVNLRDHSTTRRSVDLLGLG